MRNAEVIRQWQILREIEARRAGVTIHELARQVKVSTRTIRRDLQALQEAGFAVFDEGEEHETKRWRLNAQPFRSLEAGLSIADVAALYLSRSLVEALSGWPLAEELRAVFEKIEHALNPRMREFLSTLPHVISAKAGPRARAYASETSGERARGASPRERSDAAKRVASERVGGTAGAKPPGSIIDITRRLFDATHDRRVLEMRYFSAKSNRAKSYLVHPYRLALAQGGVYLVAWVPQYDEFRTFAVERIERLSVSDETFRKTRELPADVFGGSLGVFWAPAETIVLEFDARVAPFVRGRLWHESQQLEELPGGRLKLSLRVSNDWALRSWVLGFGAAVRVIEPAPLADALLDELKRACAHYEPGLTFETAAATDPGPPLPI